MKNEKTLHDNSSLDAWQSRVTVAAIIENNNKFLLIKEHTSLGEVYNQPAGHLENNETILQAVIRETLEETGQIFSPKYLVGIYNCPHHIKPRSYIRFTFFGEIQFNPVAYPLDSDILSTHWLSLDEIRGYKLRGQQVLNSILDYKAGNQYPLSIIK